MKIQSFSPVKIFQQLIQNLSKGNAFTENNWKFGLHWIRGTQGCRTSSRVLKNALHWDTSSSTSLQCCSSPASSEFLVLLIQLVPSKSPNTSSELAQSFSKCHNVPEKSKSGSCSDISPCCLAPSMSENRLEPLSEWTPCSAKWSTSWNPFPWWG